MLITLVLLASLGAALGFCTGMEAFSGLQWLWLLPVSFAVSLLVFTLLAAAFFLVASLIIDTGKPQTKDSKFYRRLVEIYLAAARVVLRIRIHTEGLERVPATGRFLLVCNHCHDSDPALLLSVLAGKQLAFIAKREVMDFFVVGKLLHKLLGQAVNRENDREALKTILRCVQLLQEDIASVAVFPEGYIYPDRKLHHFRHGVFKIAKKAKVPVVVCTMTGTKDVYDRILGGKALDIQLHFLGTIPVEEHENLTTVELSEKVYNMMAEDLGPENVSSEEENT